MAYWDDVYNNSLELSDGWYKVEELLTMMKNYPQDFTDEDFDKVIEYLRSCKDNKNANRLLYEFNADRYEGDYPSIDRIKCEYLDGYFNGDTVGDMDFMDYDEEFSYNIEPTTGELIIVYTDYTKNEEASNAFLINEWYNWEQKDFERAINETIYYGSQPLD